jgi:hypothetical protein
MGKENRMIEGKVYTRIDGTYVITKNGMPYHVLPEDSVYNEVVEYTVVNPELVEPEQPIVQTIENKRIMILAELASIDEKCSRPLRSLILGVGGDAERAILLDYETRAAELRLELASL